MTNEDPSLQYKGVGEGGKVGLNKEISKKKNELICYAYKRLRRNN